MYNEHGTRDAPANNVHDEAQAHFGPAAQQKVRGRRHGNSNKARKHRRNGNRSSSRRH
jgi:hypothetical protein